MTPRQMTGWLAALDELERSEMRWRLALAATAARGDKAALDKMMRDLS